MRYSQQLIHLYLNPQVIVLQANDFMVNPRPLGKIRNYQVVSQHLLQRGFFAAFHIELAPWMMIAEIVCVNNTTIFTTIPAKLMATFLGFNLSSTKKLCSTNAEPLKLNLLVAQPVLLADTLR